MIKRLRVKFVCVVMAIVMLLLGIILGVVIHFTGESMESQSISMLRTIAASPFQQGSLGNPSEEVRLPFFTVQISSRGDLMAASGGYFDLSDQDYVVEIVRAAMARQEETGVLEAYHLRYLKNLSPGGYTIVFCDTTTEEAAMGRLVTGCLVIFAVALIVFLGISILLSNWAVRPVEKAWEQQRQFVADASHELKTPLSVIMANAELMQAEEASREEKRQFAGNILTMTYQMRSLVENMLEMARVDNGAVKLHFAPVDFSQLVTDAVLSVQLLYEERGLGLQSRVQEGISLSGSEQHLYQVLDVLLDNALKYSTPGGLVSVSLSRSGKTCLLAVSSPGEPISQEDLKQIFKRFYRADRARAMNGSYGLGLSIAESVVTAHKGKIWAESGEGGNTFYVRLPATQDESILSN